MPLRTAWLPCLLIAPLVGCGVDVFDAQLGYLGDRDGDGFVDADEELAGSDANDAFNWDFDSGQWPDFTDEAARDLKGADFGHGWGQTVPDFLSVDQYGNLVPLHTFYGYAIILDFIAGWCGPCRDGAPEAQRAWVDHRLDGVIVIHMVLDDDNLYEPGLEPGFQQEWAGQYGIDFPVLYDEEERAYQAFYEAGVAGDYIPLAIVLDPKLRVSGAFVGSDTFVDAEELALDLAR